MLMATPRQRNLVVGVAGALRVLDLYLLSLGALDLRGYAWSVGRERGQANIFSVLLQGKGEVTSEGEESKNKKSTRFKLRVLTAGACFSAVKGRSPSSSHTGTTDVYVGMMAFRPSKLRSSG